MDSTDRLLRGVEIARRGRMRKLRRHVWIVGSATHSGSYLVDFRPKVPVCTCPDHETRGGAPDFRCKHTIACLIRSGKLVLPSGLMADQKRLRPTYRQDWPAYNRAQQYERDDVTRLLRALTGGIIQPAQGRGRPRVPLADIVYSCVLKVYTGFSSRRVASDVRAARDAQHIDEVPSHQTICRYLGDESLTPLLRALVLESASPLADIERDFAVDATGFSTGMYDRWFDFKYGRERKRERWVKAHAICGTATHIVTYVAVTDASGPDGHQLPELVHATATRFQLEDVSADKAYLSKKNIAVVDSLGAVPYIPFKTGTTGKGPELWQKMWAYYQYRRQDFLKHYHARSNVETVFSMVKRKFGSFVRSKMLVSQENELLCKFIAHNLCVLVASIYELGLEAEFWKGATPPMRSVH